MRNLATEWTKDCKSPEDKEKLEALLRHSTVSLGRLREIIQERMQSLARTERMPAAYSSPNWAYMQAHTNGMLSAYHNIDQLLQFIDNKE